MGAELEIHKYSGLCALNVYLMPYMRQFSIQPDFAVAIETYMVGVDNSASEIRRSCCDRIEIAVYS